MIRYRWIRRTDRTAFCEKRTCWIILNRTGTIIQVGIIISSKILINSTNHGEKSTSQDKPIISISLVDVNKYCRIKIINGKK